MVMIQMSKPSFATQQSNRGKSLSSYWPLIVLIGISCLVGISDNYTNLTMLLFMHSFMGFFLCCFAMLKLFHPHHFADGFAMIDLLAKKFKPYGYVYPYLELILGLGYFSHYKPVWVYSATIILLSFSAIGVINALIKGIDINCPCMGSILEVPVSTVTLVEDIGMIVMAIILLGLMV